MSATHEYRALALRDRVVIMLLFDQIVKEPVVREAWQRRAEGDEKKALWRYLLNTPDVDKELIYEEAARVYGMETARISKRMAIPLLQQFAKACPKDLWEKMIERRVVPYAVSITGNEHRRKLVLACHDPLHEEVKEILKELDLPLYEVRYAKESELIQLLAEAFWLNTN